MTDHDPTPDPEVAAALHRWAAATDPTADLVGGPAIRAGATGRARWTSHRALLVAAAVLVTVLAASAVWALGDDDAGRVTTDPGPAGEDGVRLDVVVDTSGVDLRLPSADRAVRLEPLCDRSGPCPAAPADLPQPIELGVSLVWSGRVPAGSTWEVVIDSWSCGGTCPIQVDGTPPPEDRREPRTCRAPFAAGGPTVAVVGITTAPTQELSCEATVDGPTPKLTVPPSFTLRARYPWSCGFGAVQPGFGGEPVTAEDEQADIDARACLADILRRGGTAELPVEEIGPADQLLRSWWRTSPDDGLVIVQAPSSSGGRWSTRDCTGLVEDGLGQHQPDGCDDPREADVVYEPPTDGDEPPTTTGPAGDDERRDLVVVFADARDAEPTIADRWVLVDDGAPVDDGPLVPGATSLESVDLPASGDLSIRWDRQDCSDPCPTSGADGVPVNSGTIDETACEEAVPPGAGPVVVRFQSVDGAPGGATCGVTVVDELPPLTVPPAWSLRERYPTTCGAESATPDGTERECLVDAADAGRQVELTTFDERDGPGLQATVWRVTPTGITVTALPNGAGEPWLQVTCAEILLAWQRSTSFEVTGCGADEELSLDPP